MVFIFSGIRVKILAECSSEASVKIFQTIRCHIPGDSNLNSSPSVLCFHRYNWKFHSVYMFSVF
jgi:hypothetical protein